MGEFSHHLAVGQTSSLLSLPFSFSLTKRAQLRYQQAYRSFGTYGSREEVLLANKIAREQLKATGGFKARWASSHKPLNAGEVELNIQKAKEAMVMGTTTSASGSSSTFSGARIHPDLHNATSRGIKPLFKLGDRVYAAWWEDEWRSNAPAWYPGVIKSYEEVWIDSDVSARRQYGPLRLYSVEYDDGDELVGVEDCYVFSEEDYLILTRDNLSGQEKGGDDYAVCSNGIDGKTKWVGVRNVIDKESSDQWANTVGWYNATLDGAEQSFSFLSGMCLFLLGLSKKTLNVCLRLLMYSDF